MTQILRAERAIPSACALGEVPIWDAKRQMLWWCDVKVPSLSSYDPASGARKTYAVPGNTLGSWAFMKSGDVLLALEDGLYAWTLGAPQARPIRPIAHARPHQRLNDGRCDAKGRFWVGSMNQTYRETPVGVFYRLDVDGTVSEVFDGFTVPNSVAFSPDQRRMYFADTPARKIFVFDFDLDAGHLSNKRLFADCTGSAGGPDGSTVDVDGCLWNADFKGSRVVRYTPDGVVDTVIPLPVSQPTSCAFGGKDLDLLFITTASQNLDEAQRGQQPLAGDVLVLRPGTQGLPEPLFGA